MTRNEIKKAIYKEKPIAKEYNKVVYGGITGCDDYSNYICSLLNGTKVHFVVPHKEMGEKPFNTEMPAQLLIRWMA